MGLRVGVGSNVGQGSPTPPVCKETVSTSSETVVRCPHPSPSSVPTSLLPVPSWGILGLKIVHDGGSCVNPLRENLQLVPTVYQKERPWLELTDHLRRTCARYFLDSDPRSATTPLTLETPQSFRTGAIRERWVTFPRPSLSLWIQG